MTKLEEKLLELGYRKNASSIRDSFFFNKPFSVIQIVIYTDKKITKIKDTFVDNIDHKIKTQKGINNLQQAFNQLQKDLEVLREYENIKTNS